MAEEEKESKILNITKLKIKCASCGTVVITDLGKSVYACPTCEQSFSVNRENNYFIKLKQTLETLKSVSGAEFSLICEEQ